jgi:hypothetical protein
MAPVNEGFGSASQDALVRRMRAAIASSHRFRIAETGNRKERECARRAWDGEFFTFRNPVSAIRNYFVTLIFPPSPRAFTLRSYIDSAKTGGTTKFPRLHDLI